MKMPQEPGSGEKGKTGVSGKGTASRPAPGPVSGITSLDLHFLAEELDHSLANSKVDKIYQLGHEGFQDSFLIQLHVPNEGRKILNIHLPGFVFLSDAKGETPETPSGFSVYLRKLLSGARLRGTSQHSFERVLTIELEKMDKGEPRKLYMVLELFGKGNLIIADAELTILSPYRTQNLRSRTIRKGGKYVFPSKKYDFLGIKKQELWDAIAGSGKESLVKFFATEMSLGGLYSEKLCSLAEIDKSKAAPDKKEFEALWKSVEALRSQKQYQSYSTEFMSRFAKSQGAALPSGKSPGKASKFEKMIALQKESMSRLEAEIRENTEKADFIYNNYQEVSSAISSLTQARKKHSWKEIREMLKGSKKIKSINEKESKVTMEF